MTDKNLPLTIQDRERLERESTYTREPVEHDLLKRIEELEKENHKNK